MSKKFKCLNCGKKSSPDDAGSNWNPLGRRNNKAMFACECGHGIYSGLFSTSYASPEEVGDQKAAMRNSGIDPDKKIRTTGDIKKAMKEAPPGDTSFSIGDRVTNPLGGNGTVKDIVYEGSKMYLKILYDKGEGDKPIMTDPVKGKVKKIV